MARHCTVCTSEHRDSIDSSLALGRESYAAIARRFGLGANAVRRHADRHLSPALKTLRSGEQADAKASLLARVETIIERAERMFMAAASEGRNAAALEVLRELRLQLELYGKATGELASQPQVVLNLMSSPEWIVVRDAVLTTLMQYPEARQAVAGRLLELEAGEHE